MFSINALKETGRGYDGETAVPASCDKGEGRFLWGGGIWGSLEWGEGALQAGGLSRLSVRGRGGPARPRDSAVAGEAAASGVRGRETKMRTGASEKFTVILPAAGAPRHTRPGPVWAPGLGGARAEARGIRRGERFSRRPSGMFSGHTDSPPTPRKPGQTTTHGVTTHGVRRGAAPVGGPTETCKSSTASRDC